MQDQWLSKCAILGVFGNIYEGEWYTGGGLITSQGMPSAFY